jgi:hypothetical protein
LERRRKSWKTVTWALGVGRPVDGDPWSARIDEVVIDFKEACSAESSLCPRLTQWQLSWRLGDGSLSFGSMHKALPSRVLEWREVSRQLVTEYEELVGVRQSSEKHLERCGCTSEDGVELKYDKSTRRTSAARSNHTAQFSARFVGSRLAFCRA